MLEEKSIKHDRNSRILFVLCKSLIHTLQSFKQRYIFLDRLLKKRAFAIDFNHFHQPKINRVASEWIELIGDLVLDGLLNLRVRNHKLFLTFD